MLNDTTLITTRAFVGGEWIDADSGKTFAVVNPADGSIVGEVADLGVGETRLRSRLRQQCRRTGRQRRTKNGERSLRRWYDPMLANKKDLALIMTMEMGKPIGEARGEVVHAANFIDGVAEESKRARGEVTPTNDSKKRLLVSKQPVGVVAAITLRNDSP